MVSMSFLGLEVPKESPTKKKKVQLQEKHPANADGLKVVEEEYVLRR